MSSALPRRAALLLLGLPFLPVGVPDAAAGGGGRPATEVDRCVYLARGHAADHAGESDAHAVDPAKPGGGGETGNGPKTPTCAKTYARWTAFPIAVWVDDVGDPTASGSALSTLVVHVLNEWACHSGLAPASFTGATSAAAANVTISWGDLGTTGILGQVATSYFGGLISHSDITMNSNQAAFLWTLGPAPAVDGGGCATPASNGNTASSNYDLLSVLLHEFGHSLGMSHPNNRCRSSDACYAETMYSCTDAEEFMRRSLNLGDVTAISSLYGP